MTRTLLIRGMIAGLVAGLLVFGVGRVFGEPQVDRAIAFETAMDEAKAKADLAAGKPAEEPEPELVSRPNQAGPGLFTGTMVYSAAFGGLFALVFAFVFGRVGASDARLIAVLLAAGGFIAVYLVPNLKYPANPPSVGQPETIAFRTAMYFLMMGCSTAAMVIAVALRQRMAKSGDAWSATLTAAAFYVVAVAIVAFGLPAINEVPDAFDAVLLWKFRMASLAMQAVMWTTLGLLFGALAARAIPGQRIVGNLGRMQATLR